MMNRSKWSRTLRGDDGATLVIVAIVLVVLLGMVGLALDVGAIYSERAQLSRGADAVALAVAEECVTNPSSCDEESMLPLAQQYANANVSDGAATIHGFDIDTSRRRVEVITESLDPDDGTSLLKTHFLKLLGPAFTGTTVQARAVAIWGWLSGGIVAPFTFPECVWWADRELEDAEEFIYSFQNIGETHCQGLEPPGGFGFLDVGDDCTTEAREGETAPGDPGTNWVCTQEDKQALQNAVILVPLHDPDLTVGSGTNAEYTIVGMAAFHVTGYRFPGGGGAPAWPAGFSCPAGTGSTCIKGKFVDKNLWVGDIGGTPFGVAVIRLDG